VIPEPRTARFLRAYLADRAPGVVTREVRIDVGGVEREATLFLPGRIRPAAPGWVVLHGMTVPGRRHAAMNRFVRALAASGAVVVVPDVPPWRELRIDAHAARATIAGGAAYLATRPEVREGGIGTVGFSFGATQALIAAADPTLAATVRGVVAFGGYCDVARMVRALFTGEHEWAGSHFRQDPDPYGRWILAGNFLTGVPGFEGMASVERAALELALESGRRGAFAWEPVYDPWKAEARARLDAGEREVWDLVAPPSGARIADSPLARTLSEGLAATVRRVAPVLDAVGRVGGLTARAVLSHGRADRLIPWTETLRLRRLLPERARPSATITGLFAHSSHAGWMHPLERVREAGSFVRLLNRALYAV
jgi:hypothetical protein